MIHIIINSAISGAPKKYLDPGTGSMLIQIVLAALLGAGVAIRIFWRNIKAFFTGKKASDASVEDSTEIITDDPTAVASESVSTKE